MFSHDEPGKVLTKTAAPRQKFIDEHDRAMEMVGYNVRDPETVDRVITAWRFALPDKVRAAWERAETPMERILAVARGLENHCRKHRKQV